VDAGVLSGVGVTSGVASGVGSGVGVGEPGVAVGLGVGLGVGFGVGLGVGLIPHVFDDAAFFVPPLPAEGIVSNPSGRTPVVVNRRAAIARIFATCGIWIEPRSS
jgi:hypothetical protein